MTPRANWRHRDDRRSRAPAWPRSRAISSLQRPTRCPTTPTKPLIWKRRRDAQHRRWSHDQLDQQHLPSASRTYLLFTNFWIVPTSLIQSYFRIFLTEMKKFAYDILSFGT